MRGLGICRDVVFSTVLMDAWYASKPLLLYIENLAKTYDVALKPNRLVNDSNAQKPYQRVDVLQWTDAEQQSGKRVKLHKFPRNHKVKVFRGVSSGRTDKITYGKNHCCVSPIKSKTTYCENVLKGYWEYHSRDTPNIKPSKEAFGDCICLRY